MLLRGVEPGIVIVTGAGSGIGWESAKALAALGQTVVAGVLNELEMQRVKASGVQGIIPLELDVTNAEQIAAAVAFVESAEAEFGPVRGVVNNAGLVVAGPLEFISDPDLRVQFDVNVLGLMAVTRAFLPALRSARGRIINIGSVGGRLSVPFTGPYGASKFAVRALSDALRVELRPSGVHVVLIEPGPIATPIWERSLQTAKKRIASFPARARQLYDREIDQVMLMTRKTAAGSIPVDRVVEIVVRALESRRPRAQYLVGAQAYVQAWAARLPASVRDVAVLLAMGLPTHRPK